MVVLFFVMFYVKDKIEIIRVFLWGDIVDRIYLNVSDYVLIEIVECSIN